MGQTQSGTIRLVLLDRQQPTQSSSSQEQPDSPSISLAENIGVSSLSFGINSNSNNNCEFYTVDVKMVTKETLEKLFGMRIAFLRRAETKGNIITSFSIYY